MRAAVPGTERTSNLTNKDRSEDRPQHVLKSTSTRFKIEPTIVPESFQNDARSTQNRAQNPSKIAPGGLPHRSLIFEAFWEPFWLHFGTPRSSKNKVFVWNVLHFLKNRRGWKKDLKSETWLSRNGKRVRSESSKHRKRRKTRREKPKQRREEPEQNKHPDWS